MAKTIIVTGAGGFIGRNLAAALNSRGCDDLLLVDTLGSDEKWRNLVGLRFEDIVESTEFLERIDRNEFSNIDAVLHMGACSSTTEKNADFLLRNNYRYTRALCERCLQRGIRFIYASSAATYGDGSQGHADNDAALQTLRPMNMYGYSKHIFDLWAQKHGLFERIAGLKYFNVFGPYEDHKGDMRSMASKAHQQISRSGKVQLFKSYRPEYADGEQMRDFIYVKDAVTVTLHFLDNRDQSGLFNCGTGKARSWNDLARSVFSAMNIPPRIEYVDMPPAIQGKYQYFTQASTEKLRSAGYARPFTPLEDAVREYVVDYLNVRST